ncbi:unnamed protein product [Trichobilharzia regenti]|nr:unnamed protein product [Trichobilharzia regenti]
MGSKSKNKGCSKKNRKNDSHSESQQLDRIAKVCCKGNNEGDYYLKNDPSAPEFREQLNKLGLDFREVPSDGNCLFSSLSDQLYGTIANHKQVREQAVLYIETHKEEFEPFFDVKDRLNNLRSLGTYGGHECIIAISRYFSVYIIIHQLKQKHSFAFTKKVTVYTQSLSYYILYTFNNGGQEVMKKSGSQLFSYQHESFIKVFVNPLSVKLYQFSFFLNAFKLGRYLYMI